MRNLMFIVVLIAGIIAAVLYVKRLNTVPADVRGVLGDSVKTMQAVPDAVRDKVQKDFDKAQRRLDDALGGNQ